MTLLNPLGNAPTAVDTAGVAPLRIWFQFCAPSAELNTPCPEIPAYKMRAPAGDVVSSTRDRASPTALLPCVQFCPASFEKKTPLDEARYRLLLFAGSTITTLMFCPTRFMAFPLFPGGNPDPS